MRHDFHLVRHILDTYSRPEGFELAIYGMLDERRNSIFFYNPLQHLGFHIYRFYNLKLSSKVLVLPIVQYRPPLLAK